MKAVFISDAHLNGSACDGYRYLMSFLDSIRGDADELFIVGDFFDFWFSDNNSAYPGFYDIIEKLLEIKKSGTNISFFEGNHEERLRRIGLVKPDLRSILSPYENLHIEKRKIIYIPYVNAPEQGTANFGYLTALHGWWTNKNAATSHAQTYGCCVFGHTHRIQTHQPLHAFSGNTGFNIGCTCRLDLPWQKSRPPAGWQQAFGYARIYPNNHFTLDTARLIGDIFTIDGKRYERKRKFRWQTPDPPKADRQNYEPPRT